MIKKRAVLLGGSGMLGRSLLAEAPADVDLFSVGRSQPKSDRNFEWVSTNILDFPQLRETLDRIKPDIILNSAASIQVDACESNREEVRRLHVALPDLLSQKANQFGAHHTYISTDAVFDGQKKEPYVETDRTHPLNYYAETKLEGEFATLKSERALALRVNMLGWRNDERLSFGQWTLDGLQYQKTLTMFKDVFFTPLSTIELAKYTWQAIELGLIGLYHAGGGEHISKHEFAVRLADRLDLSKAALVPIEIEDKGLVAKRPKNLGLNSTKFFSALDHQMPTMAKTLDSWLRDGERLGKIKL